MKLLKVFLYHQSNNSYSTFGENYRYLCHNYKIMAYTIQIRFLLYNRTNAFIRG